MKIRNKQNNVENNIRSILLDDGHFLFRLKKKSTSSTWSYFDIINTKGITLIALIITIILMLILAGVVLSLTIGENGLFKTARETVTKTEEETAREKLELVLADLQARKYTDDSYDEKEYIDNYLIKEEMPVSGNIVEVNGWKFEIDRTVPKIGQHLGKGGLKSITIVTPYVGTATFTTKISYVYNEEEIEAYTYKIDGEEVKTIVEKEYTTENELESDSTHTVQVIAKYKDGTTIQSNIVTFRTEPRTYLYNNGVNSNLWTNAIRADSWNKLSLNFEKPVMDANAIFLNFPASSLYRYSAINTKNKIDVSDYKILKMNYEIERPTYVSFFGLSSDIHFATVEGVWDGYDPAVFVRTNVEGSLEEGIASVDINEIHGDCYVFCLSAAGKSDPQGRLRINSIWLEK